MSLWGVPMSIIVGLMFVLLPSLRRVLPKCPIKPSPWPPSSSSSAPSSSPSARCSWLDTLESPRFLHRSFFAWSSCCLSVRRCCLVFFSTRIEPCLSSSLGSWSSCLAFTTCASLTMHLRVIPDTPMMIFPTLMTETLHTLAGFCSWSSKLENVEIWPIRLDPVKKNKQKLSFYTKIAESVASEMSFL